MKVAISRRAVIAAAAVACVAAVLAGGAWISARTVSVADNATVAKVNGEAVTAAEFRQALGRQRAAVIEYFRVVHDANASGDFWHTDYNGETPAGKAKEWALDTIARTKLQLQLAASYGIVKDASREAMLAEMKRLNAVRGADMEAGRPVYGPLRFDESGFADFYMGRMWVELKEKLFEDRLTVTDEQLLRHYEQVKDELFRLEDHVRFAFVTVSYAEEGRRDNGERKRLAATQLQAVRDGAARAESVPAFVAELRLDDLAPDVQWEEREFNSETARHYYRTLPELYDWLNAGAGSGSIGPVIDDLAEGRFVLALVLEREAAGYSDFAEQRDVVLKHYKELALSDYLDRLADEAVVETTDHYERIVIQ